MVAHRADSRTVGRLAYLAGLLVTLLWHPHVPDLAAQTARSEQAARDGLTLVWTGWFAGISPPAYSVLSPLILAGVGLAIPSAFIFVSSDWGAHRLTQGTTRPRLGRVLVDVAVVANLLCGRWTFGAGMAAGLVALGLMRGSYGTVPSRSRVAVASLLGVLCVMGSPLAGLFLAMACLAVATSASGISRAHGLAVLGVTMVALGFVAMLFSDGGAQPVSTPTFLRTALSGLLLTIASRSRVVRHAGLLTAAAAVLVEFFASPIGNNAGRLIMLVGAAAFLATARGGRWFVAAGTALLLIWPVQVTAGDLHRSRDMATSAAYSAPLIAELATLDDPGHPTDPFGPGRVEVVDTQAHWVVAYAARSHLLARGWERQADLGRGHLFYDHDLTPNTYRAWLAARSVHFVALPDARLDASAVAEAGLIRGGLPYLRLIWTSAHWRLYAVNEPGALATGVARVVSVTGSSVVLEAAHAGDAQIQVWWSRWYAVDHGGCAGRTDGQWTRVHLPAPGTYRLTAALSWHGLVHPDGCSA